MQFPKCKIITDLSSVETHGFSKQINVHFHISFKCYSYTNPSDYLYISICLRKAERPIMLGGRLVYCQDHVKKNKVNISMSKRLEFIDKPIIQLDL